MYRYWEMSRMLIIEWWYLFLIYFFLIYFFWEPTIYPLSLGIVYPLYVFTPYDILLFENLQYTLPSYPHGIPFLHTLMVYPSFIHSWYTLPSYTHGIPLLHTLMVYFFSRTYSIPFLHTLMVYFFSRTYSIPFLHTLMVYPSFIPSWYTLHSYPLDTLLFENLLYTKYIIDIEKWVICWVIAHYMQLGDYLLLSLYVYFLILSFHYRSLIDLLLLVHQLSYRLYFAILLFENHWAFHISFHVYDNIHPFVYCIFSLLFFRLSMIFLL